MSNFRRIDEAAQDYEREVARRLVFYMLLALPFIVLPLVWYGGYGEHHVRLFAVYVAESGRMSTTPLSGDDVSPFPFVGWVIALAIAQVFVIIRHHIPDLRRAVARFRQIGS